jgi:hypothetical protein
MLIGACRLPAAGTVQEVAMTIAESSKRLLRQGFWARLVPAVVAVGLLAGCVVVPAYGPGPYYRGYYAPGGYYYPYYRDRDDYYRRW